MAIFNREKMQARKPVADKPQASWQADFRNSNAAPVSPCPSVPSTSASEPRSATSLQHRPLLDVRGLTMRFSAILALDGVSFEVLAGQVTGLIGPNGAGKTTLFNCLSRLYAWQSGEVYFDGRALSSCKPHEVAALGIGRTFQNLALFDTMSVMDNVKVGRHPRLSSGLLDNMLRWPSLVLEEEQTEERAWTLLCFLRIDNVAHTPVGQLPFGTRKRVELARALMSEPRILLLDEPAAGLNHEEVNELGDVILAVRDKLGVSVLLVEHHMGLVMRISDRVIALNFGRFLASGSPDEIRSRPDVVEAYLGTST